MITIKGERYYNDFTRENLKKSFSNFDSLFQWLKDTSNNFTGYGNYFPRIEKSEDVGRISISDGEHSGWEYWIYEISTDNGIVFATGQTTNGHKFCAAKVKEWLSKCNSKMTEIKNKPNFVEI